jgi:hypothetical protein
VNARILGIQDRKAVPYPELNTLVRAAPEPERLILIVNIGRCGSTLRSKALNLVEGVTSYSEPDVYTQSDRKPFGKEQTARVRSLLARHPTFNTPDIVLPGTLQV